MKKRQFQDSWKISKMMPEEELMLLKEDAWSCRKTTQQCILNLLRWSLKRVKQLNSTKRLENLNTTTRILKLIWAQQNLRSQNFRIWSSTLNEETNLWDVKLISLDRTKVSYKEKTLATKKASEDCKISLTGLNLAFLRPKNRQTSTWTEYW